MDRTHDEPFRQVVEMAPNAMVMINQHGIIELVNAQTEKIFGYARADLLGQSIEVLLPERFRGQHPQHRSHFFACPSPRAMGSGRDLFGRRKDGSEFPVEIGLNPITTPTGVKVLSAIVDISERTRAERKLRESDERFRLMIGSVQDYAFIMLDTLGRVATWNAGAERLKGYREEEIIGQHFSVFYTPEDIATGKPTQELGFASQQGRFEEEGWRVRKDGSRFFASVIVSAVHDPSGTLRGFVKVTRDITAKKHAEEQQLELNKELQRINEELRNFAYIASHDLKSPLRGIDQLATWIEEDLGAALDSNTQNHLRLMRSRIKRLEFLLDDLLAFARIGRSNDAVVTVNTRDLVHDIFDLLATAPKMQLRMAPDMPSVQTQKVPLELVLRNLISNAVKHHDKPQGVITVSARTLHNATEFSVQDDGPGIPVEHQQRVFAMFQTLKPRDQVEGSGMGLAMVKKAVEAAGGKVMLESDGQNGCVFRFTWPTPHNTGDAHGQS